MRLVTTNHFVMVCIKKTADGEQSQDTIICITKMALELRLSYRLSTCQISKHST